MISKEFRETVRFHKTSTTGKLCKISVFYAVDITINKVISLYVIHLLAVTFIQELIAVACIEHLLDEIYCFNMQLC